MLQTSRCISGFSTCFLKAAWFVLYSGVRLGQLIEPDNNAEMNETCIVTQSLMFLLPVRTLYICLQDFSFYAPAEKL